MSGSVQTPSMPYNPSMPDFRLKDLLDLVKRDIKKELNCHAVATVQSFTNGAGTNSPARLTATINYQKTTFELNDAGQYVPVLTPYPILVDCPVIVLGGGGARMTFPIAPGDECLVLFNDRDLDNWYQGATTLGVPTARMHSFADGIALVGLYNSNRAFSTYDAVRAVLYGTGSAYVGVGPSLIKIANNATTLNTQLQALITQLKDLTNACAAITVTCAAPGNPSTVPINAATITAVATQLTSIASQIGGLLE